MKAVSLNDLSCGTFRELLNSAFRVHGSGIQPVDVLLIEVTARDAGNVQRNQADSFSLVFRGPRQTFVPQGMYRFEQEKIGAFDLFIVPIGEDKNGFRYEAVFNRCVSPA